MNRMEAEIGRSNKKMEELVQRCVDEKVGQAPSMRGEERGRHENRAP